MPEQDSEQETSPLPLDEVIEVINSVESDVSSEDWTGASREQVLEGAWTIRDVDTQIYSLLELLNREGASVVTLEAFKTCIDEGEYPEYDRALLEEIGVV